MPHFADGWATWELGSCQSWHMTEWRGWHSTWLSNTVTSHTWSYMQVSPRPTGFTGDTTGEPLIRLQMGYPEVPEKPFPGLQATQWWRAASFPEGPALQGEFHLQSSNPGRPSVWPWEYDLFSVSGRTAVPVCRVSCACLFILHIFQHKLESMVWPFIHLH